MQFQDWGEEDFIQYLTKQFPPHKSIVGIGDDCAIIPAEQGMAWLITTDALVEGVHFIKSQIPPSDLGFKCVAVSVSDMTAKGGESKYAFLSVALPKTLESSWLSDLIGGIRQACDQWNVFLLGGDTVESKRDLFFSLTLMGTADLQKIKYRHLAKPGDILCVSGYLGDSGGGLKALQQQLPKTKEVEYLIHAHFHPEPQPSHGIWLAAHSAVHAMMDISDGLICDLRRLLKSSQVGAVIEISNLPISDPLSRSSRDHGWNPLELALTGGEDYCLLLTVVEDAFEEIQHSFQKQFGQPLYPIGRITDQKEELLYQKHNQTVELNYKTFDHFR